MRSIRRPAGRALLIVVAMLMTAPSFAATKADKNAPVPADRGADLTTATYGDWQLRCGLTDAAANKPDPHRCEVIQNILVRGQTRPFAQLGFGRLAPHQPIYFTAVVPVDVAFPSTIRIATGAADKAPVEVNFTRCLPSGCFASIEMTDAILNRWRGAGGQGFLIFKSGGGKDVKVPMSFRGLDRALDAYQQQQ